MTHTNLHCRHAVLLAAVPFFSVVPFAFAESLAFVGTCDRDPLSYRVGEEMAFSFRLVDKDAGKRPVSGRTVVWTRTGDDGVTEKGEWISADEPLAVRTRLGKPGFVRIVCTVREADGKAVKDVRWDGGAGASLQEIPEQPLPGDFDAFWKAELARIAAWPCQATVRELKPQDDGLRYAQFTIPLPDGERPATGLVSYPKNAEPGSLPMTVLPQAYGFGASHIYPGAVRTSDGPRLVVLLGRHGEELREDKAYYRNLETNVLQNFCFRNNGKDPRDTDYYKMLARDLKGLQWAKKLPVWNRKELVASGGSMGGYQALALAALDRDVTRVVAGVPWSQDFAGPSKFGRLSGWFPGWTKALDYLQGSHFATRITVPVEMSIGLGDYVCPPSGQMQTYRNLRGTKKLTCTQNMGHGPIYGPDAAVTRYVGWTPDLPPTEASVRAAEAEAKKLQQQLTDAREANRKLAKRREALDFTADLISGRRDKPPTLQVVEKEVLRLCEEPVTLDNRKDGKRLIWSKWLSLKGGCRYRVRAKIGIGEISGTGNFKYGMMVTRPGKDCDWPAAFVGGAPFAEKEICFDYFCPVGGGNLFVIGFETGKGVATFRDVRFCELIEVLK